MKNKSSETDKNEIRRWLRRMYDCRWTFTDNVVTIYCDGEEFNIDPATLDDEETEMLIKIIQDANRETTEDIYFIGSDS